MTSKLIKIAGERVNFVFDAKLSEYKNYCGDSPVIFITDENLKQAYPQFFSSDNCIVLPAGEQYKQQATVDGLLQKLIDKQAGRNVMLIGVGGGVITDITGYAATIYLRGVRFGFYPTSLLAMTDAAVGGKNGVDVGVYKNLVGTIRQPGFIAYDFDLLQTLPREHWQNGMAEVIKHACIADAEMFQKLEEKNLDHYQQKAKPLGKLIMRNALLKAGVVKQDPFESGERRKLNFGHTLAHAIENDLNLLHGYAVSIGMAYAAAISHEMTGFKHTNRIVSLLKKYGLPHNIEFNAELAVARMYHDKKRHENALRYILLSNIGEAVIQNISVKDMPSLLRRASEKLKLFS